MHARNRPVISTPGSYSGPVDVVELVVLSRVIGVDPVEIVQQLVIIVPEGSGL